MRKILVFSLALMFALTAGVSSAAEKKGKKEDTAGKDKEMAADKDKKDAGTGKQETFTGPLTVKPKDSGKDVVCALISKRKGEKEAILKLEATGDLAKEIDEIRKKGIGVKVTGVLSDDTIKVSKVEEYVKMKK